MRRSLGKFSHEAIGHTTGKKAILLSTSSSFDFSTTAGNNGGGGGGGGGGRGGGRGRGSDFPKFSFVDSVPGKREQTNPEDETSSPSPFGHGRGKPLQSSPNVPPVSSIGASGANTVAGRGRGTFQSPQFEDNSRQTEEKSNPRTPVYFHPRTPVLFRKDGLDLPQKSLSQDQSENQEKDKLPKSILSLLSGAGRGKPTQSIPHVEKVEEVNRHIKPRQGMGARGETQGGRRGMGARGGGWVQRGGFSARGRGMGRGWGRGRGRGRGMSYRDDDGDDEDEEETADDKANAEKLARYLGPKKMDLLVQAYEEAGENVLPSPEEDAFVDAMHTNLLLECEPEYLMAEFDSNPDIDEKPPISLQDALEKMKPFLMAYEDIQTNKEWQDVVEETMKHLPLMKELVDEYSGPNRSTAKKQGEELERVAKTLPASTPSSVKRFTDRAVLSLQSNPGWGFHRKCQFMDKLVWEVSQSYK